MRTALAAALLAALSAGAALAQTYSAPAAQPQMNDAPAYPVQGGAGGYANRPPPTPEQRAARQAMRQACAADTQKFCADAQTTGQRPFQCMRQHMADLSPGCTQAIQSMRAARQAGGGLTPGAPRG